MPPMTGLGKMRRSEAEPNEGRLWAVLENRRSTTGPHAE
jgi:hypothetical protein